jgi:hypothetical protein
MDAVPSDPSHDTAVVAGSPSGGAGRLDGRSGVGSHRPGAGDWFPEMALDLASNADPGL